MTTTESTCPVCAWLGGRVGNWSSSAAGKSAQKVISIITFITTFLFHFHPFSPLLILFLVFPSIPLRRVRRHIPLVVAPLKKRRTLLLSLSLRFYGVEGLCAGGCDVCPFLAEMFGCPFFGFSGTAVGGEDTRCFFRGDVFVNVIRIRICV